MTEQEQQDAFRAAMQARKRYSVIRYYQRGGRRTIHTGLTLEQAQAHCNDPETSSTTATGSAGRKRTRVMGAWFDGYTEE